MDYFDPCPPSLNRSPLAVSIVVALLVSMLWLVSASHAHDGTPFSTATVDSAGCGSILEAAIDHDRTPHEMPRGALSANADCCVPCVTALFSQGLAYAPSPADQPANALEQAPTEHSVPPRLKPPRIAA